MAKKERISILTETELDGVYGMDRMREAVLYCAGEEQIYKELPCDAIFILAGQRPDTAVAFRSGIKGDESGRILTGRQLDIQAGGYDAYNRHVPYRVPFDLESSVPGIFAAGDCRAGTGHGIAAAMGDGNAAASMFWQYLQVHDKERFRRILTGRAQSPAAQPSSPHPAAALSASA